MSPTCIGYDAVDAAHRIVIRAAIIRVLTLTLVVVQLFLVLIHRTHLVVLFDTMMLIRKVLICSLENYQVLVRYTSLVGMCRLTTLLRLLLWSFL